MNYQWYDIHMRQTWIHEVWKYNKKKRTLEEYKRWVP